MRQLYAKMTVYFIVSLFMSTSISFGQTTIYTDDFTGEDGKGKIGTSAVDLSGVDWSIDVSSGSFSDDADFFAVQSGVFEVQDVDGTVKWTSETFSISGYNEIEFSFDAKADGNFEAASDVFDVDIFIDGSPESLFSGTVDEGATDDPMLFSATELTSSLQSFSKSISSTGSNAYIVITANNNADDELYGWDNIIVYEPATKTEPTNHPTSFSATATEYDQIDLSWNDNDGATAADGFLIVGKTRSGSLYSPSDGTEPSDDTDWSDNEFEVTVSHGSESYSVTGLDAETTYDFRIYPYTNSGSDIDFKTDGTVPTTNATTGSLPNAWINELHYDNDGTDTNEGVEVVIENAGNYTLSDFKLTLYNDSDSSPYDTNTLDEFDAGDTQGNFTFYHRIYPQDGIQNGSEGLALSHSGNLIQFLSYEGWFTASGGPADGVTSTDIGVSESNSTATGKSLQLTGNGTQYSDFTWTADLDQTWGAPNNAGDQSLPVSLTSFNAEVKAGAVQLSWVTESEIRNQGFIVERKASEPDEFIELSSYQTNPALKGAGSTAERNTYTYTDTRVEPGKTYWYRLTDISFEGKAKVHDDRVLKVTVENKDYDSIEMQPAFPNPFNTQTRLTYHLPEATQVVFELYDIRGVKLTDLYDARQTAGSHDLYVSLPEYPSGIYFVRMNTGSIHQVQKLMLIK